MTHEQNEILTEIYGMLNYKHQGNLNAEKMLITFPSRAKFIQELHLIETIDEEFDERLSRWYKLTEQGKIYFSKFIESVDKATYDLIMKRLYVKEFSTV